MKAILILEEIPKSCNECPISSTVLYEDDLNNCELCVCTVANTESDYNERPSSCPLKPLPQKKDFEWTDSFGIHNFKKGFNACLDEIIGDEE